jgi:hypothetical protein
MRMNRQEVLHSASRRVRRGRRATGRLAVSALGFGVAYYFDTENGGLRRKRLQGTVHRVMENIAAAELSEDGRLPTVLHPALRVRRAEDRVDGRAARVEEMR